MPGSERTCSKWRRASAEFPRASRATASATANKGANDGGWARRFTASVLELREVHLVPLIDLGTKRNHAARRAGDVVVHLGSRAYERARAGVDVGDVDRVVG